MKARRMRFAPAAKNVALLSLALLFVPEAASARSRYDATIVRSTYGIPHISARDHAGLGYGVGYTAAQDNICLIADQLLTARGERSRFLGAGYATVAFQQVSNVESDLYHKIVGDLPEARKSFAAASKWP